MPTNNRSKAAQTDLNIDELVAGLEEGAPPVAAPTQGQGESAEPRPGRSAEIQQEREQVAALYSGIRQQYFDSYGTYPSNIALEDEAAKHLMSVMFGINLMKLGAKRAEAVGCEREAAYISILDDLGIDTKPFVTADISGKRRFNWRYYQSISYKQALHIRECILSAYSTDLRKDK